ncbi:MAG: hypothetical protein QOG77_288, partial [Solirubrobacteraceae bacterium]|nr:hypothetical protein [Solirubrobacteraceae bacterium]
MTVVVHLVTDQDSEAPACAALLTRLATAFPAAEIELCAVLAHDTLAAGFCVAQLARSAAGDEQVIGHWVTETPDAAPRRLCVGRSLVGTLVVGPNEGFAWSFALPELRGLCFLDIDVPA